MSFMIFASASSMQRVFQPSGPTVSLTQGTITFELNATNVDTFGYDAVGKPWVNASGPVTLTSITPTAADGKNGAVLNPIRNGARTIGHGLDDRMSDYDELLNVTLPIELNVGDVILKVISTETPVDIRSGYFDDQAALHIVNENYGANDYLSASVLPDELTLASREKQTFDIDAWYTSRPTLDMTVMSTPIDASVVFDRIGRFAATMSYGTNSSTSRGYEAMSPIDFGKDTGTARNYGGWIKSRINGLCIIAMAAPGGPYSEAEIKQAQKQLVSHGIEWGYQMYRDTTTGWGADGGHYQWMQAPIFAAYHAFGTDTTGLAIADTADKVGTARFGNWSAGFEVTPDRYLELVTPHDNEFLPTLNRQRLTIAGGTGNELLLEWKGPSQQDRGDSDQVDWAPGTVITDGTNTAELAETITLSDAGPGPYTVTLTAPSPFADNVTIWSDPSQHNMAFPLRIGQFEWTQRGIGSLSYWSNAATNTYREIQGWSIQVLYALLYGQLDFDVFKPALEYTVVANNNAAYPDTNNDYSGLYNPTHSSTEVQEQEVWEAHYATARAVPQINERSAPTINNVTASANGTTGANNLSVNTNQGRGKLYWAIFEDDYVAPSDNAEYAAAIALGTDAVLSGSQDITDSGVQNIPDQTGLTEDTGYNLHVYQYATNGGLSTILKSGLIFPSLVTPPSDITVQAARYPGASINNLSDNIPGLVVGTPVSASTTDVEIAGIATDGAGSIVEARIVNENAQVVQDWTGVGTISGGTWSGTLQLPLGAGLWYNVSVRSANNPSVTDVNTVNWGVGYKFVAIGQSQFNIWAGNNVEPTFTMSPAAENKMSLLRWQASNLNLGTPVDESFTLIDNAGPDGPRSFADQFFTNVGELVQVDVEAVNGTTVMELLDNDSDVRRFSDFTNKTNKYGNDYTAVLRNWQTSHSTQITGQEFDDYLRNVDDRGGTLEEDLISALQPWTVFTAMPATRNGNNSNDIRMSDELIDYVYNTYPTEIVGPPITDYALELGQGPHPEPETRANINFGQRLAMTAWKAIDNNAWTHPYFTGNVERSLDGTELLIETALPNGGSLSSPAPAALSGFSVNGSTSGFTTSISGTDKVRLTIDSGTWPDISTITTITRNGRFTNTASTTQEELDISLGELYETFSNDVLGLGIPVHGELIDYSGTDRWRMQSLTNLMKTALTQEAEAAFVIGDWSVATGSGNGDIDVTITNNTQVGDQSVTVGYAFDGGSIVDSGFSGTGTFQITAPDPDTSYDITLYKLNGATSAVSDVKTVTSNTGGSLQRANQIYFGTRSDSSQSADNRAMRVYWPFHDTGAKRVETMARSNEAVPAEPAGAPTTGDKFLAMFCHKNSVGSGTYSAIDVRADDGSTSLNTPSGYQNNEIITSNPAGIREGISALAFTVGAVNPAQALVNDSAGGTSALKGAGSTMFKISSDYDLDNAVYFTQTVDDVTAPTIDLSGVPGTWDIVVMCIDPTSSTAFTEYVNLTEQDSFVFDGGAGGPGILTVSIGEGTGLHQVGKTRPNTLLLGVAIPPA